MLLRSGNVLSICRVKRVTPPSAPTSETVLCHCFLMFLVSGYGVFATQPHPRGSFLLEYPGILMLEHDALNLPTQDYVYFFQWQGKDYA